MIVTTTIYNTSYKNTHQLEEESDGDEEDGLNYWV